ncbi:hypothetical protein D1007_54600 [Hordeum vulgare]|nr:hypothetical protein D1007_54600 [Hordeum vulgare]
MESRCPACFHPRSGAAATCPVCDAARTGTFGVSSVEPEPTETSFWFQPPSSKTCMYDDDEPIEDPPLDVRSVVEEALVLKTHCEFPAVPRGTAHDGFAVLVHAKAPGVASTAENTLVDLVTVLDVCGSMEGRKVELLKEAMGFVVDNLGPADRLSVVSFSDHARRVTSLALRLPALTLADFIHSWKAVPVRRKNNRAGSVVRPPATASSQSDLGIREKRMHHLNSLFGQDGPSIELQGPDTAGYEAQLCWVDSPENLVVPRSDSVTYEEKTEQIKLGTRDRQQETYRLSRSTPGFPSRSGRAR